MTNFFSHERQCGCSDPEHLLAWVNKRIADLRYGREVECDEELKKIMAARDFHPVDVWLRDKANVVNLASGTELSPDSHECEDTAGCGVELPGSEEARIHAEG